MNRTPYLVLAAIYAVLTAVMLAFYLTEPEPSGLTIFLMVISISWGWFIPSSSCTSPCAASGRRSPC